MGSVQSSRCQGSSPSSVPERGEYHVDRFLDDLGRDGEVITVLEIGHYRRPLQHSKMGLLHDFIGLRLTVVGREKLIKAEKFKGKIKISNVESLETNGAEIKHGPVGVGDCGEIAMGDLLAILKEHSPDYSLLSDNSWKYADSTFRRLIRNFSAHPTISPERRSELVRSCQGSSPFSSCQGSSPSSVPERGKHIVDRFLQVLGADGEVITVLEIGHYRRPFQHSKMGLLHDFIGLRLTVVGREKLIKAEKFKGKIEISIVESLETNGAEIKHGPVGVGDCGEIAMGDLLAILKEHSPDYSLLSDNCWKYADSTFRRLIRNFSAHPTISPERRSELEGFLNHPTPTMPDNVIFSCVNAFLGGAGSEAGLAYVASIGASVLGASAVAVNLFPPEQLAQLFVTLKCATVQNFLHSTSATLAQSAMPITATVHAPAPAILQILSAPQTMQAVAAAQSQAQTMLPAFSPHLSHAAVVTGSKISAVVAAKLVTVGKAVAVTACHFFWPFAITMGVLVALYVLYKLGQLALEATPWGQRWLKKLRAFFSRRRTGPSMTSDRCPCSTPQ